MRKPSIAARALSTILAAAVLWTAPGLAAHAAAATIIRALPPAASLPAVVGASLGAAAFPVLNAAAAPAAFAPLAASAAAPLAAGAAPVPAAVSMAA
ncbi:MAG: hypothetical protein KGL74_02495, partial [Elusimicrobia bacterium]|nr:hypothetical protein [Elusimicrobiota bacterium]